MDTSINTSINMIQFTVQVKSLSDPCLKVLYKLKEKYFGHFLVCRAGSMALYGSIGVVTMLISSPPAQAPEYVQVAIIMFTLLIHTHFPEVRNVC